jgi:asparagine synthase (glutamine-hydrolysing)
MDEALMCGIVGIASRDPVSNRGWIVSGVNALRHRGPDDIGEWWSSDYRIGLAHRRLAIIDLSPAAHQPMPDVTGRTCIVFNGEIYNFTQLRRELAGNGYGFRSHSDTEVILAAYREWGVECLSRLNGMFAFAIYDKQQQNVFIARDRVGEKPLFYSLVNGVLRFASELKGLMADPAQRRRVDPEALDCYLAMGYVPGNRCILQGVSKLPPAHALTFNLLTGQAKVWRYWSLPDPLSDDGDPQADESTLLDELTSLLENSVRGQLVADVPVGILLSGGVDSSLVTAIAARASSRAVKTFTVRFPGYGQYDETEHARLIARHFGTEHVELNGTESTVDLLPLLARQFDEPVVDSSMIPTYLVTRAVRDHCKVALGGDGGDELFGGYHHYSRLLWMQRAFGWIPRALRLPAARAAGALLPVGFKGRNWLRALSCDLGASVPRIATFFGEAERKRLVGAPNCCWRPIAEHIWGSRVPRVDDFLQRITRMDFENYMAEDILVKVDRASMCNSLEVRAPMLDYRVVEFAFGRVPSSLKATARQRKILLKKLATRLLPVEFDKRRKQGFSIPLAEWLKRGPWRDRFLEILGDPQCLFNRKVISKLIRGQDHGMHNQERLFGLVLFELWRREYQMSL